jgi:hypothetical protein
VAGDVAAEIPEMCIFRTNSREGGPVSVVRGSTVGLVETELDSVRYRYQELIIHPVVYKSMEILGLGGDM